MFAQEEKDLRVQSSKAFQWYDYAIFTVLSLAGLGAVINFLSYWVRLRDWHSRPVSLGILSLLVLIPLAFNQFSWFILWRMRRPVHRDSAPGLRVGVVTTFVPGAESFEMLEATMRALVAMDYPHDTWVLDEGDDPQVKRLCRELGVYHFSRKNRPEYQAKEGAFKARTKYGNVNSWLAAVGYDGYDYLCAFDPDHVPARHFLNRMLGYFRDPAVGYVQAAQAYYNQSASFISRGAAEETYSYYSSLQMSSYSMGYPIITGCHNLHRMGALKGVGGFAAHDADDLLLTLHYLAGKWRGVYVPESLAVGLTPVDWSGYLGQQLRWARSVLDIKFRILPRIASRLPLKARIMSFLHGLNYIEESMIAPLGLLSLAYLLASGDAPLFSRLFAPPAQILVLLSVLQYFFRQRFFLFPRNEWGLHWRATLLRYAKWPQIFQALFQAMLALRVPYTITRKAGPHPHLFGILWPHAVMAGVLLIAWIIDRLRSTTLDPVLHLSVAAIFLLTVGLVATSWIRYPAPFDLRLLKQNVPAGVAVSKSEKTRLRVEEDDPSKAVISAPASGGRTRVLS